MDKRMIRHLLDFKGLLTIVLLSVFLQTQPAFGTGSQLLILGSGNSEQQKTEITEKNATSSRVDSERIETVVVKLSDEQVQRLIEAVAGQSQDAASADACEGANGKFDSCDMCAGDCGMNNINGEMFFTCQCGAACPCGLSCGSIPLSVGGTLGNVCAP